MRKKEKEITDQNLIEEILSSSLICRVALFDNEYPYIVPMNYGYKENTLYFHCALEGKKIDLIKQNNKVGFEIEYNHEIIKNDVSCKWTTNYTSIIGNGVIEIVSDYKEKIAGLDILMQQHGKIENEYIDGAVRQALILKLNIKQLTGKQSVLY